ncbi:MAG: hypothetical protein PHI06_11810 [Desulfobulbaceae bacterium]|nr:hypothetical protein [Desulfobulbaceae bacterium]
MQNHTISKMDITTITTMADGSMQGLGVGLGLTCQEIITLKRSGLKKETGIMTETTIGITTEGKIGIATGTEATITNGGGN